VGVEDDDRRTLRPRQLGIDRRVATGDVHEPGGAEPRLLEEVEGHASHPLRRLGGVARERDRRDGDQLLQIADDSRHRVGRPFDDLLNIHGWCRPFVVGLHPGSSRRQKKRPPMAEHDQQDLYRGKKRSCCDQMRWS
jgi:hypothetical protein